MKHGAEKKIVHNEWYAQPPGYVAWYPNQLSHGPSCHFSNARDQIGKMVSLQRLLLVGGQSASALSVARSGPAKDMAGQCNRHAGDLLVVSAMSIRTMRN